MNNEWSIVRTGAVLIIGTALNTTANAQAADTASSARAKERVDRVAAEVAATQFIASDPATRGSLILDQAHGVLFDRRVSHSNGTHLGQPKRPETHAKHLAQLLSASLVDGDSALGCGGDENRCHLTPAGPLSCAWGGRLCAVIRPSHKQRRCSRPDPPAQESRSIACDWKSSCTAWVTSGELCRMQGRLLAADLSYCHLLPFRGWACLAGA